MGQQNNITGTIMRISIAGLLLIVLFNIKNIIEGGPQITLQSAPALSGQVAQSFTSGDSTTLPIEGQDYKVAKAQYFDNNDWVVVNVTWLTQQGNDAMIVLKKTNGIYTAVLGPGSSFSSIVTESMPVDVGQYLNQQGVLDGASN